MNPIDRLRLEFDRRPPAPVDVWLLLGIILAIIVVVIVL